MEVSASGNRQITEHFNEKELYSKSYDAPPSHYLNDNLVNALEYIRTYVGQPVYVTSTFRTTRSNALAGGANNSEHLTGNAVDFYIADTNVLHQIQDEILSGESLKFLLREQYGINGFGLYDNFMHIDCRASETIWDNRTSSNGWWQSIVSSIKHNEDGMNDWKRPLISIVIVIVVIIMILIALRR
jgi:hypothetical protein